MNDQNGNDTMIPVSDGASTFAPQVDALYADILWISVVVFVVIVAAMLGLAYRYRRQPGVKSKPPGHHPALQLSWILLPLIFLAYIFHQGMDGFMMMAVAPANTINIRVRAYPSRWEFEQPNGLVADNLVVPLEQPVRLIMSSVPNDPSADDPDPAAVIHSFFVPAFRVKRDVVPGMYTSVWFAATRVGEYQIYCAEYCGEGHSGMLSNVEVLTQVRYRAYLREGPQCPDEIAEDHLWGQQIFVNEGCPACHNVDPGQPVTVGPNLANVAGTNQPLEGGGQSMADSDYLRRSLAEPQAEIVEGFTSAAMTVFDELSESHINALIAYMAHISDQGSSVEWAAQCGEAGDARRAAEAEGE